MDATTVFNSSTFSSGMEGSVDSVGGSSFGRDSWSATTLALPSKYSIFVVYSAMHDNWYVCRAVKGSVFL